MKNKAKNIINAFAIVFFLVPIFASAAVCAVSAGSPLSSEDIGYPYGSNPEGRIIATKFTPGSTCSVSDVDTVINTFGSPTVDIQVKIYSDSAGIPGTSLISGSAIPYSSVGGSPTTVNSTLGSGTLTGGTPYWLVLYTATSPGTSDGFQWNNNAGGGGISATNDSGTWNTGATGYIFELHGSVAPPPPPPAPPSSPGLSQIVNNATSSFETKTGFTMNSVGLWMWENLGKPFTGSGIGVFYTLRWYIMVLIILAIIIFFAFRYYKYFKT